MKLKRIINIISAYENNEVNKIKTAKKYYKNNTEINDKGVTSTSTEKVGDEILRHADNRISHNYHQTLVDEKASYLFTYPPIIDIDNNKNKMNSEIKALLGDNFSRKLKHLCIEASNCGVAWIHYWLDIENNNKFEFEKVNTEECIAIRDNTLKKNIIAFIRFYDADEYVDEDSENKVSYRYIEYWNDKECTIYKLKKGTSESVEEPITFDHYFKEVPFICFANNIEKTSDLDKYKKQIDLFDKVMSGYANDMEDIQQIIYILENYGGQDLDEFKTKLKRYKTLEVDNNEITGKGDLRTLQIDIPVEARKIILEELDKEIYDYGQGLQRNVELSGNLSGVALKFMYRKLEIKSSNMETEFREGVNKLVEVLLKINNIAYKTIEQIYTRNMISNDLENSQIAMQSLNVIPHKMILQNHPWVDDVEEAEQLLKNEKVESEKRLEDEYFQEDTSNQIKGVSHDE